MRKLFLLSVLLGLIASPSFFNQANADERIISFYAGNFDNISSNPTYRWPLDRLPTRPLADGIRLEQYTGSPRLISLSPTQRQETDDCVAGACITSRGGSPYAEFASSTDFTPFTNYYTPSSNWTTTLFFNFTTLPVGPNLTFYGVQDAQAGNRSWTVYYDNATSSFGLIVYTDGTNFNIASGQLGPISTNKWYMLAVTHSSSTGTTSAYLYDESGQLDSISTVTTPFASTTAPLTLLYAGSGGVNYIDYYDVTLDEILWWTTTLIAPGGLTELAALINEQSSSTPFTPSIPSYQLTSTANVTNSTGAALTNYTIPFTVNFADLVDFGFLDSSLKDFLTLSDAFSDVDYMITAGNPVSNGSYVFANAPLIQDDQTFTFNNLVGLPSDKLDKIYKIEYPFIFTGNDSIAFGDSSFLDLQTNFVINSNVSIDSPPTTKAWILEKMDAGLTSGYGLAIDTNGDIIGYSDADTCTLDASDISYPINDVISYSMGPAANPYIQISLGSDILVGCNLTDGATQNSEDLNIGTNLEGNIYNLSLYVNSSASNRIYLTFDPTDYTQTQEGNAGNSWTWQGNIFNGGSSSVNDGTYEIISDQTGIAVNQTGLVVNTPEDIPAVPTPNPNIIGTPPAIVTTPTPSVNLPFTPLIIDSADQIGITDQALWFIFIYAIAVMFAFGTHILLNTEFLSLMVLSIIVLTGTLSGIYAAWLSATTIPLVLGVYALAQLRRVGQVA